MGDTLPSSANLHEMRCIICHDTAPHDCADNKQHTRTRHIAHLFTRTTLMIIGHVHTLEKM